MNFEELSDIWNQNNDTKPRIEINEKLLKEVSFTTIRNSLAEIKWASLIELFINYIWMHFLVDFIIANYAQLKFSLPAAILIFIALFSIVLEAYKLYFYATINNQLSLVEGQQKLEKLRFLELFDNYSLFVFIPMFFIPFVIVAIKGFIGIDIYELGFSVREMLFGTAGTIIISIIIVFFLNLFPNKKLRDSIEFLKEINEIQEENHETANDLMDY